MTKDPDKKSTTYVEDETTWKEGATLGFKGFLMGAADVVPGVSGGTIALITGIYDRWIQAIRSFDSVALTHFMKGNIKGFTGRIHWKFIFLLALGMFLAILFFTRVVPMQIYIFTHPELVFGLFFGLIIGSVVMLLLEVKPGERTWKNFFPLIAGAAFGFWIVTLVPTDTPETFSFVFLSGAIAISALMLPGISGSYLLLIFRKYDYILTQLAGIGGSETVESLINLLPFVLGLATGLILFSRILTWLLKRYHTLTLVFFTGFLIGSIHILWPFQERVYEETEQGREIYSYHDPSIQALLERDEIPVLPEYRIATDVLNPEDTLENWEVEIIQIRTRVIASDPVWPDLNSGEHNVTQGTAGIILGIIMVGLISVLRRKG